MSDSSPSSRSQTGSRLSSVSGLGQYDALVLTGLIWFLAKFLRYAFPPLFEPLQGSYGVSNTVLGLAFTGFMVVYAAMQFPSGVLADRIGSITVITAGVVLASSAALLLVFDSPFLVLVVAMLVMGAGTGAHKTVAVRLLARAYPARTGRALGFFDTVGTFGGVAAPMAVVFVASLSLATVSSWRLVFVAAGLVGLVLAGLFVTRAPKRLANTPPHERDDDSRDVAQSDDADGDSRKAVTESESDRPEHSSESGPEVDDERATSIGGQNPVGDESSAPGIRRYATLFRDPRFSAFVLATICFSFTYNGLVAFAPLYMTDEAGLELSTANLIYSALFAVSLIQLVTGEMADRVGTLPVIVTSLTVGSLALIAFVALTGVGSAFVLGGALVAVGLGSHGFRPVRGAYLMAAVPPSISGGSLGVVRTLLMGAGAIAPAIVGYLSETVGFRPAFWVLAASITIATLLCAALLVTDSSSFRLSSEST
ncbi:MFS transporter [Halobacteria archaeon AArc-curdl1]|uniref:MFS transporter n=1 Tax=Natronosalvus hydrolyticus TaxID=2979988 RepID=A0AAP2ZC64_9EURY|nr:MFS transporter [Halobacteria archaeon AArc-curdl1]